MTNEPPAMSATHTSIAPRRPVRSATRPIIQPPRGRKKNAAPKVAKVSRSARSSFSFGKIWVAK